MLANSWFILAINIEIFKNASFFEFFRSIEKLAPDGPKWGQADFFLILGRQILYARLGSLILGCDTLF